MNFSINLGIFVIIGMIMGLVLMFIARHFQKRVKQWVEENPYVGSRGRYTGRERRCPGDRRKSQRTKE